jgi:HK97 family phage portal protein
VWPFKKKQAPQRFVPSPPFIDGMAWATTGIVSTITPQMAENLAAILGAVNAIASTISSLPAFVTLSDDTRAEQPDHPLQRLINVGVNDNESWADFSEGLLSSCLLKGNALASVETDTRGRLTSLRTVPWQFVTPWVDEAGVVFFDYIPNLPPNAGQRRRLLRDDVLFLKDRSDNGVIGVSRLTRAAGALQIALDLQTQSSVFLQNAARPGGTITPTTNLGDEQRTKLKTEWDIAFRGREYGKVAVLPSGATYAALNMMSAEDAQLVAHRNFSVADVCRIFSVPPWLLADPTRATLASATAAMRSFTLTGLLPWIKKLEAAFAQSVLSTSFALHFDVDALVKADIGELYTSLLKGRQGGWLTPNDCRSETGFQTVAGGDSLDPPVAGGLPASDGSGDTPSAPPPDDSAPVDDASKVAVLGDRRARHGGD